jgi:hypothetical protein
VLDFRSGRWTQQRVASTISRGLPLRDRRGKVLLRRSSKSSRRSKIPVKKYRDRTKVCQCARAGNELVQKEAAKIRSQIGAELLCRRQPKRENEHADQAKLNGAVQMVIEKSSGALQRCDRTGCQRESKQCRMKTETKPNLDLLTRVHLPVGDEAGRRNQLSGELSRIGRAKAES